MAWHALDSPRSSMPTLILDSSTLLHGQTLCQVCKIGQQPTKHPLQHRLAGLLAPPGSWTSTAI